LQYATNVPKNSYMLNNNIFSLFVNNVVRVMSVDLSSSGRLFHTQGPHTAKLRSPYFVRVHGVLFVPNVEKFGFMIGFGQYLVGSSR